MKKYHPNTPEGELFINLSEQLRFELEAKMDILWLTGQLKIYFDANFRLALLNDECEIMINCLKNETGDNYSTALTICKAIKVWYGMYYDDRLSVISKFDSLYKSCHPDKDQKLNCVHLKFVPFCIIEFSKILTQKKWTPICSLGYD